MSTERNKLLKGLADIFEVAEVSDAFVLDPWDSLNVMQTVVLIDDCYHKVIHGGHIVNAKTVADIIKVAEK